MGTEVEDITPQLMPREVAHFKEGYEITCLPTATLRQSDPSWVVYRHIPLVGALSTQRRFVAMFASDTDAYEYVAIKTALDAGLEPARLLGGKSTEEE